MKLILSILFFLTTVFNYQSNAENSDLKKKTSLRVESTKMILTPPTVAKKRIVSALEEIERSCCEDSFLEKEKIFEIKNNLQTCIDKRCYSFLLPLYVEKKPPAKLVALRNLNVLEDLLIAHDKHKYDNLIGKLNLKQKENLENEKDINVIRNKLNELENKNIKLKKTVDKMLINYEKKIKKLKKENEILSDNFNLVFKEHSKNKQKKLEKELK